MVAVLPEPEPTSTVTVSIGRNIGKEPMDSVTWRRFKNLTREALRHGELVFEGDGEGVYEGSVEMSATFVAAMPDYWLPLLRNELGTLRRSFDQDAIALTVGTVEFV